MIALVMLGTFFGVLVNELLPDLLVYIMLTVTLTYLAYSAITKSIETHKKEKAALAKAKELADTKTSINNDAAKKNDKFEKLLVNSSDVHNESDSQPEHRMTSRDSMAKGAIVESEDSDIKDEDKEVLVGTRRSTYKPTEINNQLDKILKDEKTHFRPRNLIVVILPFCVILLVTLFRGTPDFKSLIKVKRCDALDFILLGALVVVLTIATIFNIIMLKKEYELKEVNNYQFVKGDVVWDRKSIIKFLIFALIAGFLSGAVGLSGGVLFTPLFLEFGIAPSVASSTSMYMAMFATGSSSILYMFSGFVIYDITFWLSAFSIIGTYLGSTIIGAAVKKSGKQSILVWLLAIVITASAIIIAIEGITSTIKDHDDGVDLWKFNEYCQK